MIFGLALPNKTHALLTILGEGTLLFLGLLIDAAPGLSRGLSAGTWKGRRISAMDIHPVCPTRASRVPTPLKIRR